MSDERVKIDPVKLKDWSLADIVVNENITLYRDTGKTLFATIIDGSTFSGNSHQRRIKRRRQKRGICL